MEYIDLLNLLRVFGTKGMEKVEIYGKLVRKLPKPDNIKANVELSPTAFFAEMELFAVNLGYHQSYLKDKGIKSPDDIYMVNGSVLVYIEPNNNPLPEWYTLRGTLRCGTQDLRNTYIGLLTYTKTASGAWSLKPSLLTDVEISEWNKNSECYYWINTSWEQGRVVHPKAVDLLPRFSAVLFRQIPKEKSQAVQAVGTSFYSDVLNTPIFNKECRDAIKEPNEYYTKFSDIFNKSLEKREVFLDSLKNDVTLKSDYAVEPFRYMVTQLRTYLKNKPNGAYSATGRSLLSKYLSNFKLSSERYIGNTTAGDYLISMFPEVADFMLDSSDSIIADGKAWELYKMAFANKEAFYAGMISVTLGVSWEELQNACLACKKFNLSITSIINNNPYILQLLSGLKYDSIEFIALCMGKASDSSLDKFRNIALLHNYISDSNISNSTLFRKSRLLSEYSVGLTLTASRYKAIQQRGTFVNGGVIANIGAYIRVVNYSLGYNLSDFTFVNNQYVRSLDKNRLETAIETYVSSGLGVSCDNYITSATLLKKELYVFSTMYELGKIKYDYAVEDIDKYITEYEAQVGFKLEERQRDAVHLCVCGSFIVAGSAGSGKTTVSNCIVYVLSKLEPELDIQFAAPTGKAAKRMQEVVRTVVKTLHSKFRIGQTQGVELEKEEISTTAPAHTAYFFDESAMITIDLLYAVLSRINLNESRIFLFGDFNQLPPIGKGLPFKNLLRFMPCVFLNVTKRAAEGSNITNNSNLVNEFSNTGNWQPLVSGDDFLLCPCKEENILKYAEDICAFYLGKKSNSQLTPILSAMGIDSLPVIDSLTPDDIQIVTPLAKPTYSWGATAINIRLQPLFNPVHSVDESFNFPVSQENGGTRFTVGDRVIHVDKNMYNMQWYGSYQDGVFQKVYGAGICNGEVGKIVGFFNSRDCTFLEEYGPSPDDFSYPEGLREDETWVADGHWFVVVEYFDYITASNFYILYRVEENISVRSNTGIVFRGDDLGKLSLFYAGTTHKLQGSQAKIVICTLGDFKRRGFITREMLYTMITRGEKLVIMLGSVDNSPTSMLSRARKDIASVDTDTVGEVFF